MPRNEFAPNFCLMSDFDARLYTSTLYTREGQNVSLPSASQIVFDDPIQFLNGRGQSTNYSLLWGSANNFSNGYVVIPPSSNLAVQNTSIQAVTINGGLSVASALYSTGAGTGAASAGLAILNSSNWPAVPWPIF